MFRIVLFQKISKVLEKKEERFNTVSKNKDAFKIIIEALIFLNQCIFVLKFLFILHKTILHND